MKLSVLLLATASMAVAQSVIDYTKIPACARQQCAILDQAEKNCVPPAAPVTQQAIYQSCLCQSALLTPLHSSGSLCQTAGCSGDDAAKISQYYNALCNGRAVQPAPAATGTTTSSATTTATGTSTAAAAVVSDPPKLPYLSMKREGKWVVAAIIVGVFLICVWIGAALAKRRYDRKQAAKLANMAATNAPYVPRTPNSRATPSQPEGSEMAMSGGANGQPKPAMRSRTNTLQNLGFGNSSQRRVSQPVAWGPHQNMAHLHASGNHSSSSTSVLPSSPVASATPPPPFLNREAAMSNPRFSQNRSSLASLPATSNVYSPGWTPSAEGDQAGRPRTATGELISNVSRRTLLKNESTAHISEPQSAEICEPSPAKPNKLQKH